MQDRLRWHFDERARNAAPASAGLKILAAEEPQLAVVHGLVMERAQQTSKALNPITVRHARVSYGIVVNQLYDPKIHQGMNFSRDPRDGKKWMLDQVEWLIRQVRLPRIVPEHCTDAARRENLFAPKVSSRDCAQRSTPCKYDSRGMLTSS